jgi:hypothetical protein
LRAPQDHIFPRPLDGRFLDPRAGEAGIQQRGPQRTFTLQHRQPGELVARRIGDGDGLKGRGDKSGGEHRHYQVLHNLSPLCQPRPR